MYFISPTFGRLGTAELIENIERFVLESPQSQYKLVIGTDSQTDRRCTIFVTALIVHRIGHGARIFYIRNRQRPVLDLRHRIYLETEKSLTMVEHLRKQGLFLRISQLPVEIHLDVGLHGESRKLIQEVVGWVTSVGYAAKIKPYSFGASSVADRLTKSHVKKTADGNPPIKP